MESAGSDYTLLVQQAEAQVVDGLLRVTLPMHIKSGVTPAQLDQMLNTLLEDGASHLERAFTAAEAKVTESWISDPAGEPLVPIILEPVLLAHWSLESSIGFPDDALWLGLMIRNIFKSKQSVREADDRSNH